MNNLRTDTKLSMIEPLTAQELIQAEIILIKQSQRQYFDKEWHTLTRGEPIASQSSILNLSPMLGEYDVLRVGG